MNPIGKVPGTLAAKTVMKKGLNVEITAENPLTGQMEQLTAMDVAALKQMQKAMQGDTAAFKKLMDRTEGKATQAIGISPKKDIGEMAEDELGEVPTEEIIRHLEEPEETGNLLKRMTKGCIPGFALSYVSCLCMLSIFFHAVFLPLLFFRHSLDFCHSVFCIPFIFAILFFVFPSFSSPCFLSHSFLSFPLFLSFRGRRLLIIDLQDGARLSRNLRRAESPSLLSFLQLIPASCPAGIPLGRALPCKCKRMRRPGGMTKKKECIANQQCKGPRQNDKEKRNPKERSPLRDDKKQHEKKIDNVIQCENLECTHDKAVQDNFH